jgi:hypothetical protein
MVVPQLLTEFLSVSHQLRTIAQLTGDAIVWISAELGTAVDAVTATRSIPLSFLQTLTILLLPSLVFLRGLGTIRRWHLYLLIYIRGYIYYSRNRFESQIL